MLSELTPDQRALAEAMSDLSEAAYCAAWMIGLECALWGLLASGETRYGRATLTKEEIENRIDALKYQKDLMDAEDYRRQLTALLLQLAKTQEAIEK